MIETTGALSIYGTRLPSKRVCIRIVENDRGCGSEFLGTTAKPRVYRGRRRVENYRRTNIPGRFSTLPRSGYWPAYVQSGGRAERIFFSGRQTRQVCFDRA